MDARIALVTGAGKGIGRAVSLALGRAGWTVVLTGRNPAALDQAAALAEGPVMVHASDVTDPASVDALFAATAGTFGRLDLLFNNAGVAAPAVPLDELDVQAMRAVLNTNIFGSFLCARAAMRLMKRQDPPGGRIINNGSISADRPRPNSAPYSASKHAITGLTKSIALDGRGHRICAGQIDIGNAASDMTDALGQLSPQADGRLLPEPRMNVDHVARAVVHMAGLPADANIPFMTIMATNMPLYGRG